MVAPRRLQRDAPRTEPQDPVTQGAAPALVVGELPREVERVGMRVEVRLADIDADYGRGCHD